MQPPRTPAIEPDRLEPRRVQGWRAVIEFAPKPTSPERLCAGVVVRTEDGHVRNQCAVDLRKAKHAFGHAGETLHEVARRLCESLAEHWTENPDAQAWTPPFSNARLSDLNRFSAGSEDEGMRLMLNRTSTLHTLLNAYEIAKQTRPTGIVEKVRSAVRRDANAKHLAARFNRELTLNGEAQPFKVDFLGQHYACYFLQITRSPRVLEVNTERAFGKLYELQALRRLLKKPSKSLGLLDEERPQLFELLMVGDRQDPVQRRAIYQVEALADKGQVLARIESSAAAAAERLSHQERLAA